MRRYVMQVTSLSADSFSFQLTQEFPVLWSIADS